MSAIGRASPGSGRDGEYNLFDPNPTMSVTRSASRFVCFLEWEPGAYIGIGNGNAEGAARLHSPHYDFNDAILPLGASYWVRLAESILSKDRAAIGQS
jgi:hippurate hydrolase